MKDLQECQVLFKSASFCIHTGPQSTTTGVDGGTNIVQREFLPHSLNGLLEGVQTSMLGNIDPCLQ